MKSKQPIVRLPIRRRQRAQYVNTYLRKVIAETVEVRMAIVSANVYDYADNLKPHCLKFLHQSLRRYGVARKMVAANRWLLAIGNLESAISMSTAALQHWPHFHLDEGGKSDSIYLQVSLQQAQIKATMLAECMQLMLD